MASGERVWGGRTMAERRDARRTALLDAALDLVGEQGGAGVSVRSVCRRAGLTDRYFYESFAGRDELVAALFLGVADEVHRALAAVPLADELPEQVRAMVRTFVTAVLDDPRKGRLLLVETLTDPALAGVGLAAIPPFTRLISAKLPKRTDRAKRAMLATGLAGAVTALFSSWMRGTLRVSRDELVDHCVELILDAYE